ncbi:MAG: aldehyde dehydrogenase family protein [Candidatus Aminicenantes bacterium]|nr:MAG: aldehyde dehydrogenase family protein [Candidatus Aminicenantes bacterium]
MKDEFSLRGLDIEKIMDQAVAAAEAFRRLGQAETDKIVEAVYKAGFSNRVRLAKLACEETKLGRWEDKVIKNVIATRFVYQDIKDQKTVGLIADDPDQEIVEIAEPVGPIFAITPVTNPTSTVLFKIIISMKSRNPIIIRPHGAAKDCSVEAARICYEAAIKAGAPEDCIQWIRTSTREEALALMAHRKTALILATGSVELVRAAHRSGNPAIGIGPGNVPVYIGKTADVPFAVEQILISKTFDNGTVCASEQAVVANRDIAGEVVAEFKKRKAHFLSKEEIERLELVAFNKEQKVMKVEVIGQPATKIAEMAGIKVPADTTLLIAPLEEVGIHSPLSLEILAPILAFYVADDFEQAIRLCRQINHHGGLGHTCSIFSQNEERIEYFASAMNAGRILVNTPASQGALGGTYNRLRPSLMLACGTSGKNTTTDNISAKHLLNVHRIARRQVCPCIEQDFIKHYLDESLDEVGIEKACRASQLEKQAALSR